MPTRVEETIALINNDRPYSWSLRDVAELTQAALMADQEAAAHERDGEYCRCEWRAEKHWFGLLYLYELIPYESEGLR